MQVTDLYLLKTAFSLGGPINAADLTRTTWNQGCSRLSNRVFGLLQGSLFD